MILEPSDRELELFDTLTTEEKMLTKLVGEQLIQDAVQIAGHMEYLGFTEPNQAFHDYWNENLVCTCGNCPADLIELKEAGREMVILILKVNKMEREEGGEAVLEFLKTQETYQWTETVVKYVRNKENRGRIVANTIKDLLRKTEAKSNSTDKNNFGFSMN